MNRKLSFLTGIVAAALASTAAAQQDKTIALERHHAPVSKLSTVIVHGELIAQGKPEGTVVLDRELLNERAITSWDDLGKRGDPAINFSRESKSVNIRGVDQDRVVVRVDGIRIPWLTDGPRGGKGGLSTINFSSLSAIDVIGAAGAPQSGALTGELDLRTLKPGDLLDADEAFGTLTKVGFDGADMSWHADAALAGKFETGTRWLLQVGTRRGDERENEGDAGGYGPDREKANPATFKQHNALLKLEHNIDVQNKLMFSAETFRWRRTTDDQRDQGPQTSYLVGNNSVHETQRRDRLVVGYDYVATQSSSVLQEGGVRAYWQKASLANEQEAHRRVDARSKIIPGDPFLYGYPSGLYTRDNSVEETNWGLLANMAGYVPAGLFDNAWQLGAEWSRSETQQHSGGIDNCLPIPPGLPSPFGPQSCSFLHTNQADVPDATGRQWAIWAQNEMSWAKGQYSLTPALRFDSYSYTPEASSAYQQNANAPAGNLETNSGQRVSPSLMFAWQAAEQARLYVRYGYGYKAPNATQLYMNYGAPGTYLRVGDPNLKAEVSRGWELGAELGNEDLGGSVAIFDNRYRNFIDQVGLTPSSPEWNPAWAGHYPMGVTAYTNRSRVRIYGAEVQAHATLNKNWYAWGALAWAHGRDQETGNYLNSVAPLRATLGLGYKQAQWGVETLLTFAHRHDKVENLEDTATTQADFQAPGYGVVDITGWWQPQQVKGLRLQAGIFNLFDKTYWNALNVPRESAAPIKSFTEPGRHARVWLTYQY